MLHKRPIVSSGKFFAKILQNLNFTIKFIEQLITFFASNGII